MAKSTDSFLKSLFFGQVDEELIFPFPGLDPDVAETVGMINDSVDRFAQENVKSSEWDAAAAMPEDIVQKVSELGLMGLLVDEELGGMGLPMMAYSRIFENLATHDASLTVTVGAHQSIGYKGLLLFGSPEQKEKYLPRLATGELIAAFCLTEPSSGSDAASIKTVATPTEDGSAYSISGSKLWITNGGIADFLTVFAKVPVEVDGEIKEKVTAFMVDVPSEGISVGPEEHKMGIKASWTNEIHFENVIVPAENIIGEVGKGFKVAMGILNHGRLGLAGGCVGGMKKCIAASLEHANQRRQFKKRLIEFGMVQDKISKMTTNLYAAESMVYFTTHLIDRGDLDYSLESAAAKVFASEALWEAIDETIQIWGGNGFMKEYPFEQWMRDARIYRIFEGTNEILRAFVALSGMQGPGEELAGLADAIKHPLKGLGQVGDYAVRRFKMTSVGSDSIESAHPSLNKIAGQVEEITAEFAEQVDVALRRYGKKIFLEQLIQKRLADVAIDLFGMIAVLSRTTAVINEKGIENAQLEISVSQSFCQQARRRCWGNLKGISRNDDELTRAIAEQVSEAGEYPFGNQILGV